MQDVMLSSALGHRVAGPDPCFHPVRHPLPGRLRVDAGGARYTIRVVIYPEDEWGKFSFSQVTKAAQSISSVSSNACLPAV